MKLRKKKEEPGEAKNLLDMVPVQLRKWEEADEGKVRILVPRFGNHWLGRQILSSMRNPHYYVNLDDYGSFVWRFIDGRHTVYSIGIILREQFDEAVEPVFDRLGAFLQQLARGKFIRWEEEEERPGK